MSIEQNRSDLSHVLEISIKEDIENIRLLQVRTKLEELKNRARNSDDPSCDPEKPCVSITVDKPLIELPGRIKILMAITEISDEKMVKVTFGHCKAFDVSKPAFSLKLEWDREKRDIGAVIDSLHFNIKEEGGFDARFFPLDSTSSLRSDTHFPYYLNFSPTDIPSEDTIAMDQYRAMHMLLSDREFEVGVLEDLASVFN